MDNQLQLPEFTPDDFQTTKPFEYINQISDPFQRRLVINQMSALAKSYKVVGFMRMLEDYFRSLRTNRAEVYVDNVTTFQGQPIELNAGDWDVSESGISRSTGFGDEVACVHPIIPIERYVNVDTGEEKLKIWWRKGKQYRAGIFPRRVLATASGIVQLADHGVAVNSESAKVLVRWLHDVENLNYELIPERQSVGRLGWIEGSEDEPWRFSPYAGTLEFDGDENFRSFFGAVSRKGKLSEWLIMCKSVRSYSNVTARILLAASFASVLVKPLGTLPFFVHLWGGTESGKAQPLDTRIITPNGYKLMGEINVGDKVIGRDGKPHSVTGVYPQGEKEIFELTFKDGTKTRCCREHLWYIKTLTRKEHGRDFKVVSLDEMLSMPLKKDGYNQRIPIAQPVEFSPQDEPLPIEPYLLGALIGDGCLTLKENHTNHTKTLYFSNPENDVIENVKAALSRRNMSMRPNLYSTNQFVLSGQGKPSLCDDIRALGLNVYSGERFIPDTYKAASIDDRRALLAGLIDTDGHVSKRSSFAYSTVSKKLADDVVFICRSLGYRVTVSVDDRCGEEYETAGMIYKRRSKCYDIRVLTHDRIFTSKKHNLRADNAISARGNGHAQRYDDLPIVSIEPIGSAECQCIMVDSVDHTYLCDDFIVTHNTVSLMLAASVWANPEMGRYIHTFNSTSVGKEMSAAFVNSLPLIMDELQVARSKNGQDEEVYKLAEGVGRTRSNQKLGVSKSSTWSNCILTTGESPLTSNSSGGGAVNRIINIECRDKIFSNARVIASFSRQHYGHAGRIFVERLMKDGFDKANDLYNATVNQLAKSDTTEKQAMAAAIILVGDILATEYLFKDDKALTVADLTEFLATKATVDVNGRGYQYMCEWAAQNAHRLTKDSRDGKEVWGDLKDGVAYVVRSRFNEAAEEAGYNAPALLSYMKQKDLIKTSDKGTSVTWRINGVVTKCVALVLPGVENLADDPDVVQAYNAENPFVAEQTNMELPY